VDPSGSEIDQISFEHAIYGIIIFSFCTWKSMNDMFRIEYDQRMTIKFPLNEKADIRHIVDRLQAQFDEHAYKLQTIQFWITEVQLGCQYLYDEICTWRSPLDDLDAKIMAQLDKSLFEWACSIVETLSIPHSTVLLHLHDSIGFRLFHLHWVPHLLTHDLGRKLEEVCKNDVAILVCCRT
jgi:hypothetical protein